MKSAETSEVVNAIQSVLSGRIYLSPRIFVGLFRGLLQRSSKEGVAGAAGVAGLSDRELQVFQMIGAGIPNRGISTQLSISVKTVEAHRENLKNKLGVQDSVALKDVAESFVNTVANG
jgi:DNA-binding NarL/FixJ family response regulator